MVLSTDPFAAAATPTEIAEIALDKTGAWRTMVALPMTLRQLVLVKAGNGLPPDFEDEFPIDYSICRFVADMNHPLMVDDAFSHPLLMRHPAVQHLGVAAYLGVPVMPTPCGRFMSVFCALKIHRHRWTRADLDVMQAAAMRLRALPLALPDV